MSLRFDLYFSEKEFEYDIYNLLKAFYPLADCSLLYFPQKQPPASEGTDAVFAVEYGGSSVVFSYVCRETMTEEECAGNRLSPQPWSVRRDDISFADKLEAKNRVKQLVYQSLSSMTGLSLPWGDLTGIRPVKLVTGLLGEGKKPADIASYMRKTWFVSPEKTSLAIATAMKEKELMEELHPEQGCSLYIGIPYCPTICLYCSFGSHPLDRFRKTVGNYLETLYRELAFIGETAAEKGLRLDTVYIGGGTPTTLAPDRLDTLLRVVGECFSLEQVREFTVEAGRPDTITPEKLQVLRRHPVTRISINPQTMNQKTLDIIGRQHTVEEVREKYRLARDMGFDNINMDLIIGLPSEGSEEVRRTLEEIRALDPDSLTVHALALKRATRLNLFKDTYAPVSFEASADIMHQTEQCAAELGMHPYYLYRQKNMAGNFENVGYAKEGKDCLYNILIMEERQTILAAGSGASSKFVCDGGARIERVENVKDIGHYTERIDEMLERKAEAFRMYL